MKERKRKLRSVYFSDDEYKEVNKKAIKEGFNFASYVRFIMINK